MIAPTLCTVSSTVRFLIVDRVSRVAVKAIASHSGVTGTFLNACFNDCANNHGFAPSAVDIFLIADRASREIFAIAIAAYDGFLCAMIAPTLCTVSSSVRFLIADRTSRVGDCASHSGGVRVFNACFNDCTNRGRVLMRFTQILDCRRFK